uniref:Uncharacterized protein n=1 Tax=Anopheles coluzzii TaxID=1518534 RepID=A0A8W7PIV9_ANOCL
LEKSDARTTVPAEVQTHGVPGTTVAEMERNGGLETGRTGPSAGGIAPKTHPQQYVGAGGSSFLGAAHLSGLDSASIFGNFSQLLERHMREVNQEPSMMQNAELNPPEKSRNHLKCVVCQKLFETFADIKNHECRGDRAALEKPLLAFPPALHTGQPALLDYRSQGAFPGPEPPPEGSSSSARIGGVGPSAPQQSRDSVSLVKTAGTFFPDVNANKLKYA